MRDRFFVRVYVPETHHLRLVGVVNAVEFNDNFRTMAGEVGVVFSDVRLSPEVQAMAAQQSKAAPQAPFGFGPVLAQ